MTIQPKKITKNDLIKETARKLSKSSKEIKQVIDTFIDEISVELKNENHIVALESDSGGFSPRGFSFECSEADNKGQRDSSEVE